MTSAHDIGTADLRDNRRSYATSQDFCANFMEEMASLYRLAFRLTLDPGKAEEVFAAALDDCLNGRPVFREWTHSWSRRAIIKNAIRSVAPRMGQPHTATEDSLREVDSATRALLALESLERFVFIIAVVEGYSDRETAALLDRTWQEVARARENALQRVASIHQSSLPTFLAGGRHAGHSLQVSAA